MLLLVFLFLVRRDDSRERPIDPRWLEYRPSLVGEEGKDHAAYSHVCVDAFKAATAYASAESN